MKFPEMNKILTQAAKAISDNEKLPLAILSVRSKRVAEAYPFDQTVVQMASFLEKKANSTTFITRSELKDVYQKLYTNNNKFAELFKDELGEVTKLATPKLYQRDPLEGTSLLEDSYSKVADPFLSNALEAVFDKTASFKSYSKNTEKDAVISCRYGLDKLGLLPKSIRVAAGQEDLLICEASYETPKGDNHVIFPIEIKQGKALLPSVFLGKNGFEDLNSESLQEHIVSTAGVKKSIDVNQLLNAISTVKNGGIKPLSDVEKAFLKMSSENGTPASYDQNAILGIKMGPEAKIEPLTQLESHPEISAFAKSLESPAGLAQLKFGKDTVEKGRNLLAKSMKDFGFNSQVSVLNHDDESIMYVVAVDQSNAFKVPLKVVNNKIQAPSMLISNAGIGIFNQDSINEILTKNASDFKLLAAASPSYGLKSSELISIITQAMKEKNFLKAEDALNVLQASGDVKAFRNGFAIYSAGLSGSLEKTASVKSGCCKQYKTSTSTFMICAHTNLPIHKVYQNEQGECVPLYHKAMKETSEGGFYMTSRINLG